MRRNNIEHPMTSKVNSMTEKVQELKEQDKQEKIFAEKPKSSPELRQLTLFGKIVEDLHLGDYVFTISTLNNKQQKNLIKKVFLLPNEDRISGGVQVLTLSEAIVSVNSVKFADLHPDPSMSEEERKIDLLENMQFSLVEALFAHYESMVKKSNSLFKKNDESGGEEIKN